MLSSFGRVAHRGILRCVGLALLSIVKAQHGLVRPSTGTAKFGQALVLRSVVVHGTGNARRGVVYQCTALAKYGVVLFGDVLVKPSKVKCVDVKVELSFVGRCFV